MSRNLDGRPIVVGIDGSDSARQAAIWAGAEAARRHAPVKLVSTVSTVAFTSAGGFVPPPAFFDSLEAAARARLAAAEAGVGEAFPDVAVQVDLRSGDPASVLLAESKAAALVVLGSRDAGVGYALIGGSIAVGLAAHGHCPVVVVRGAEEGRELPSGGPVVVGVDGSPASELAVAVAFEEASVRRAELVAVHSWPEFGSDSEYIFASQYIADWDYFESHEREVLAERLAGWQEKYPDVTVRRVVTREQPVKALLYYAADAQLLVVGSRGRGGFIGLLLGSTSRKLVHAAPCPLIVARPTVAG